MKVKTKVCIVGTVGIPACYGGFESLVENLTLHKSENISYTVFCSSKSYSKKLVSHNNSKLHYIPLKANGAQSILYDILSLIKCIFLKPDVVLILGVSGCIFLPIFNLFSNAKIVTNIDGLEWKRDKWSQLVKRFLKFSEKVAVKNSDVVVTDNKAIGRYVDQEYAKSNVTIAYGGDHAIRLGSFDTSSDTKNYALGLCRIEPENNVEMILEAFSQLKYNLKFVGNWHSSTFGKELKEKYGNMSNIELIDPIYDLDDLYRLRKGASLYLHGHSAGGTNPSLVEMMHFNIPIFAFDCSFNRYSTDNSAHYFNGVEHLRNLVQYTPKEEMILNAERMVFIAKEYYVWSKIAKKYEFTY
ncbi:TPA: DUF1972 domain-containing protein [Vibrio parahaemolyticus]